MTLSQSSSDMWSRNSSRVIPAQDTTTDGGREKQAYEREGEANTKDHKGPAGLRGCAARRPVHLHLLQQALGCGALRHVRLEGSVLPARRPVLAPRASQQSHRVLCCGPVQVAGGHCGALCR